MGILVHPRTVQNLLVKGDPDYDTFELQDYIYRVTSPDVADCNPTKPWVDAEFEERMETQEVINPGEAWKLRPEVWTELLVDGKFDYTYNERLQTPFGHQVDLAVNTLFKDPDSRRAFIAVWDPTDIHSSMQEVRVPCTLGYQLQIRNGQLNMTYLQRACDFVTHYQNDIYLATQLQGFIADQLDVPHGFFTHWVASMHVFRKDVKDVF